MMLMLTAVCMKDGWSTLIVASAAGHVDVMDKLIAAGAHPDLQTKVRGTVAWHVVSAGTRCVDVWQNCRFVHIYIFTPTHAHTHTRILI